MSRLYHIALGSNLGDRLVNLRSGMRAVQALAGTKLITLAPLYETDPLDCPPGSQAFYNSVAAVESELEPEELLSHLRAIEAQLGRPNVHDHHAPRTLDLDILCAGEMEWNTKTLILPHPRMHLRLFVLQPLSVLAPDLILPGQSQTVLELLTELQRQTNEAPLRLVAGGDWLVNDPTATT